jgi:hypothetical protein
MGSGCIDVYFLGLVTSWRWVVSFTPRPLYPRGRSPLYPLDRRLGGPQSRSGRHGEVKILESTGTRTSTPRSSCPSPVTIPTTLSRLHLTLCIGENLVKWPKNERVLERKEFKQGRTWTARVRFVIYHRNNVTLGTRSWCILINRYLAMLNK